MIVFISGGCKNGKSSIAEKIVDNISKDDDRYYIATMVPYDDEDRQRIKRHIKAREKYNFITIEVKKSLCDLIDKKGTFLLDSLTAFTLNHIIDKDEDFDENIISEDIKHELDEILYKDDTRLVIVSDYIGADDPKYVNKYSDKFIKLLSMIEKYITNIADAVIEVSFSNIDFYKGIEHERELFHTI